MNECQVKLIVEKVIELLHYGDWISEEKYGSMPSTLAEDIAEKVAQVYHL